MLRTVYYFVVELGTYLDEDITGIAFRFACTKLLERPISLQV